RCIQTSGVNQAQRTIVDRRNNAVNSQRAVCAVAILISGTVLMGCATKKYVRENVQPVQSQVDQVSTHTNQVGAQLDETRKDVAKNATDISATSETARAADRRAGDAMTKANQVDQKADQNGRDISSLRQTVANLDDYKVVNQATVLFGLNRATLT